MINDDGVMKLKKLLFQKNLIWFKRLRSSKGASVVFALVGFMFAAMIAFVVINAAYSAATRVKRLKYDEQSFLLAESMSGIITEALTGNGNLVELPDHSQVRRPDKAAGDPDEYLKYDALTLNYQYIEQKNPSDGSITMYFNATENGGAFIESVASGDTKPTFYDVVKAKDTADVRDVSKAVRNMIRDLARKIDRGETEVQETLTTNFTNPDTNEYFSVETKFTMNSSYSISAVTEAKVLKIAGGDVLSKYIVRMDAAAAVRTDKLICAGIKSESGGVSAIQINDFTDNVADGSEELVKVSCYSVTWPADQMRSVYSTSH